MSSAAEVSQDIAVIEHAPRSIVQVAPQVDAAELVQRLAVIEEAMRTAMKENVDYGVIPGTGTKPTLLKPGAEKLGALFQLDVQLVNDKIWYEDGHLTVICKAVVYHQPTGTRLGSGEGICTTREAKYAYRNAEKVCPACGGAFIIKGREEYGGGWLCYAKKGGCGAKYADGDMVIESQAAGKVANENIADAYNTVDKMASKRARIDAVLAVTGASALFTQDIEDFAPAAESEAASAPVVTDPQDAVVGFGKHKGETLGQVHDADPGYVEWLARDGRADIKQHAVALLANRAEAPEPCPGCGSTDGNHPDECPESVPF